MKIFSLLSALCLILSIENNSEAVTLGWDKVNGATGYKIYWGETPRVYDLSFDVGNTNVASIPSPAGGKNIYIAVTAYNSVGESDYSSEISYSQPQAVLVTLYLEKTTNLGGSNWITVMSNIYSEQLSTELNAVFRGRLNVQR